MERTPSKPNQNPSPTQWMRFSVLVFVCAWSIGCQSTRMGMLSLHRERTLEGRSAVRKSISDMPCDTVHGDASPLYHETRWRTLGANK